MESLADVLVVWAKICSSGCDLCRGMRENHWVLDESKGTLTIVKFQRLS